MLKRNLKPQKGSAPCRRCLILRIFIISVLVIAIIHLLAPEKLELLKNLRPINFAVIIVTILGVLAISKSVLEYILSKRSE